MKEVGKEENRRTVCVTRRISSHKIFILHLLQVKGLLYHSKVFFFCSFILPSFFVEHQDIRKQTSETFSVLPVTVILNDVSPFLTSEATNVVVNWSVPSRNRHDILVFFFSPLFDLFIILCVDSKNFLLHGGCLHCFLNIGRDVEILLNLSVNIYSIIVFFSYHKVV